MAKLVKQYYWTKGGIKKLNAYACQLRKDVVEKAKLEDTDIKVSVQGEKIIIEREK